MKHTKEQITKKAQQIMKDFRDEYYSDSSIETPIFYGDEIISFGAYKEEKLPTWIVGIHSLFDNMDVLLISDETSEPIYYQNFNTLVFDVKKDAEGTYYKTQIL